MKKLFLILAISVSIKSNALVDFWGIPSVIPHSYGATCLGQQYVEISWFMNWESNNDYFQVQRSQDPNFSWAITGTANFNGTVNGCGTCGTGQYSVQDYGPFQPGEVWYYRIKAVSNNNNSQYKNAAGPYTSGISTIVNWISQVTSQVTSGNSPSTESSYQWAQESKEMQGVTISMMPTEISKIYLEQNNHKLRFSVQSSTPFVNLDVNINNGGYFNLYNGGGTTGHIWQNASSYLTNLGNYNLKVRFTGLNATVYYREYDVYVVPKSDDLFVDNYCNTMRVWKGSDPLGGTPLVFSEGFDAYNTKSEQYYRKAGDDLINCLLSKGFDVYVVNYNLNAQSIKNNGAIFQSAIRYVSSINSNKKVIATGMSMGGVINRYACAKAENDGNPLPIKKFLCLDAPQQGAVISKDLQDWRKGLTVGDPFAEHAANNDAAYELLNYNTYDPSSNVHNNFFNYLNSLNGDGYPHLVNKIGVSFSTNNPNPNSGKWLYVNVTGIPGNNNKDFYLSNEELVAGSFLPTINSDPIPVSNAAYWALINTFRPFSNPMATVIQYKDPSFIPYNSALDIINGVSKFDKVIIPSTTGYHDIVPSDIIAPLVNAILDDKVYIQNKNYNNETRTIIANETIYAGNNVTSNQTTGDVNINANSNVVFKAGSEIQLKPGFSVSAGANFSAIIEAVQCDGNIEFQNKRINPNPVNENSYQTSIYSPPIDPTYQIVYDTLKTNKVNFNFVNSEVDIYPNPTDGIINIKNYKQQDLRFIIYSVHSIKLKQGSVPSSNQIDISNFNAGIYLIEIADGIKTIKTFKIIKY